MAKLPDQSPDAVQLLECLLLQLIVVEPFIDTLDGLADSEIVGALGPLTGIFTVSLIFLPLYATESSLSASASPSISVQISSKVLSKISELITSEPVVFLFPDQSPNATQSCTLLVDQLKVMLPP
ncbi:MAG: hypothetical protein OES20_10385 [Gammaproteobacteria bacterium]|nr:hypothetical protein [Gammaproteobacteria bacterium]MDH3857001.1 hypothetical protein [Gammaproteobacteria bacterium]